MHRHCPSRRRGLAVLVGLESLTLDSLTGLESHQHQHQYQHQHQHQHQQCLRHAQPRRDGVGFLVRQRDRERHTHRHTDTDRHRRTLT